jgi:hypothetical protein
LEEWRPIDGFPGYTISNEGRLCAQKYWRAPKTLKKKTLPSGYQYYLLSKQNKKYTRYVHRLVAQAFIPNPSNKPEINHIDGIKSHNCVSNLEWATHSENQKHARATGLNVNNDFQRKLAAINGRQSTVKPLFQKDLNGRIIRQWECACDAMRELGFDRANIAHACRTGKARYGYFWEYVS